MGNALRKRCRRSKQYLFGLDDETFIKIAVHDPAIQRLVIDDHDLRNKYIAAAKRKQYRERLYNSKLDGTTRGSYMFLLSVCLDKHNEEIELED